MWFLRSIILLAALSLSSGCSSSGKRPVPESAPEEEPIKFDFDPQELQSVYQGYNAVPAKGEVDFDASFSALGYDYDDIRPGANNPEIRLTITLENNASYPVRMDFRDGEIFEISFINSKGNVVYRWTDNHYVANVPYTLQFKPDETKRFVYVTKSREIAKYLSTGHYTVRIRTNTRYPMELKTGFSVGK